MPGTPAASGGEVRHEAVVLGRRHPVVRLAQRLLAPVRRTAGRLHHLTSSASDGVTRGVLLVPARLAGPARRRGLLAALSRLPEPPALDRSVEVILMEAGAGVEGAPVEGGDDFGRALARAAAATADLVCLLPTTSEPLEDGWLHRLAVEVRSDVVAATPMLVHDAAGRRHDPLDLRITAVGIDLHEERGVAVPRYRCAGDRPDPALPPSDVASGSSGCLLVDRRSLVAVMAAPWPSEPEAGAVELCCRLREHGGRVRGVPASVLADHRPVRTLRDADRPLSDAAWRDLVRRRGPWLRRQASGAGRHPASFALTIGARRTWRGAPRWGDRYLAEAFARSLRRRGHPVSVQTVDEAAGPRSDSCDVHVVLRGATPVRRTSGQVHVLWIISHPEDVQSAECDEADLVLVASARFAEHLRDRTTTPVGVMLQATDHRRFTPRPHEDRFGHDVAVVANTRHVFRPVVADALDAGLRPAIYGRGWEQYVDPTLIEAGDVPNVELPALYSSVGVLLNDHWDTMRDWGFVSNRLFDALACGTPVVSDDLPEIGELFGEAVTTYDGPSQLRSKVRDLLGDPTSARDRAEAGREAVLERHTFDHRAAELLGHLERLGPEDLCSSPPPVLERPPPTG